MKKIVRIIILSFVLIFGCVALEGMCSDAKGSKPKIARKTIWLYSDGRWTDHVLLFSEDEGTVYPDKTISIASSNENVLEVARQDKKQHVFCFNPVKPGKVKVTIKYKFKGKTYKVSKNVKVKKYPQPIKKVTLNGKDITKKARKGNYDNRKYKKDTIKINLKPKKGWKIHDVIYMGGTEYMHIENNKKLDTPEGWVRIRYILKNKKGEEVGINFEFDNWDR